MDGVAENVAELTDPDDLIDEAAETGQEEEEIDHGGCVWFLVSGL